MSITRLKERLPHHAEDLRANLSTITSSMWLKPQQAWGTALATAIASRSAEVVAAIAAIAPLSAEAAFASRGAASIMGMNNIYYRFRHTMGDGSAYAVLPPRLRMHIIGWPGVAPVHQTRPPWLALGTALRAMTTSRPRPPRPAARRPDLAAARRRHRHVGTNRSRVEHLWSRGARVG